MAFILPKGTNRAMSLLQKGDEIRQMMAVVGEEGTSTEDFVTMLKAELFDSIYLQQNAFDEVDGASSRDRQQAVFDVIEQFIRTPLSLSDKSQARQTIFEAMDLFRHWNHQPFGTDAFAAAKQEVIAFITRQSVTAAPPAEETHAQILEGRSEMAFILPKGFNQLEVFFRFHTATAAGHH